MAHPSKKLTPHKGQPAWLRALLATKEVENIAIAANVAEGVRSSLTSPTETPRAPNTNIPTSDIPEEYFDLSIFDIPEDFGLSNFRRVGQDVERICQVRRGGEVLALPPPLHLQA